jgi:hypothetical protein
MGTSLRSQCHKRMRRKFVTLPTNRQAAEECHYLIPLITAIKTIRFWYAACTERGILTSMNVAASPIKELSIMLSHCANSQCSRPFLRLGQGRLFLVEATTFPRPADSSSPYARHPPRRVERYWLCDRCAQMSTLVFDQQKGITLVPLQPSPTRTRDSADPVKETA